MFAVVCLGESTRARLEAEGCLPFEVPRLFAAQWGEDVWSDVYEDPYVGLWDAATRALEEVGGA